MGKAKIYGEEADEADKGLTAALIYGTRMMPDMPLFLEYGAKATWLHSSDEEEDIYEDEEYKESFNYLNLAVPVNAVFKIGVTDDVVVSPYVGLNLKVNVVAKLKEEYGGESESLSFFDKDEMGDDYKWNRFQLGMNLGIGLNIKKFYIGYNFQPDFVKLAKESKYPTNTISLGVNF